ncbi:MAG: aldo/keto reductase [Tannerella sp.]|jgi:predicted aldo/keto reductase-like oxidoreductase|nr:aldo/keto reductase [Tannerella sp.]
MNRRTFIQAGMAGLATMSVSGAYAGGMDKFFMTGSATVDKVSLGKTGLTVSRIAMGTGTHGGNKESDFTRMGKDSFTKLAHHAYERGITFFDMADSYGSMPYVAAAKKSFPREKLTLLSKIWTNEDSAPKQETLVQALDRFRKEADTDYLDIVLMHCMMGGGWSNNRKYYIEGLSKAKQDGIVKTVGVSCHNWDALVEASVSPWVDVIMARINPFGTLMDNTPEAVKEVLGTAQRNGKGIIAMKVFGEGRHVSDDEREKSIKYVLEEGNISCMTLGMSTIEQIDDAIERVARLAQK